MTIYLPVFLLLLGLVIFLLVPAGGTAAKVGQLALWTFVVGLLVAVLRFSGAIVIR